MLIPPVHPRMRTTQHVAQISNSNKRTYRTQTNQWPVAIRNSEDKHGQTSEHYRHIESQSEGRAHRLRLTLCLGRPDSLPARRKGDGSQVGQEGCKDALLSQKI